MSGYRSCAACRTLFSAPSYATLCKSCFVAARKAELEDLRHEVALLRAENRALRGDRDRAAPAIDATMLRRLVQLCHPDKHAGSDLAKTVTAALLSMRERAAA